MDVDFGYRGLVEFAQKRKKWILVSTALGLSSYGVYKVYHRPYVANKRARLLKIFSAFVSVADAMSDSAEMIGVFSKELKEFLQSDSDEIPNSLTQMSKITKSEEFSESVIRVTAAFTAGVSRGYYRSETKTNDSGTQENSGFCGSVMDKMFSTAGSGFASVVVGSFARNLVMAFLSSDEQSDKRSCLNSENHQDSEPEWISMVCNAKSKDLIGDCIQVFVSTAVAVYLDKTMDINFYDDFFAGLTNPKHEKRVRDLLVSVCNNSIDTLVKTSHQVLTTNPSSAPPGMDIPTSRSVKNSGLSTCSLEENEDENLIRIDRGKCKQEETSGEMEVTKSSNQGNNSSWASTISSTLSEPSNRRFILSVTGQVTFETVRSFLEFLLEKVCDSWKTSFDVVHEAAIDRGLEVVRYFTVKSFVIATICLSLCLRALLGDAWVLAPAQSLQV